mgnify:CR=1 FL=1
MSGPPRDAPGGSAATPRQNKQKRRATRVAGLKSIPSMWWIQPEFIRLRTNERSLLMMLWTAPSTPLCGIVEYQPAAWAERLQVSAGVARSALAALCDAGFVVCPDGSPLLWLVGHIEAQLRGKPTQSAAWIDNTCQALAKLPDCTVTEMFREYHRLPARGDRRREGGEGPRESPGGVLLIPSRSRERSDPHSALQGDRDAA